MKCGIFFKTFIDIYFIYLFMLLTFIEVKCSCQVIQLDIQKVARYLLVLLGYSIIMGFNRKYNVRTIEYGTGRKMHLKMLS